ncbi:MAG: aminoglycoside phosphotransferase (APT) family kinase protein [Oceanicoccus sp.]|jgi:aminoglycoside phosphotransferase (APT) family kinase protein
MSDHSDSFNEGLARVLVAEIDDCISLKSCERLSGGASQETYRLEILTTIGSRILALRRSSAGGFDETPEPGKPGLFAEAQLFRLARQAGVPEPEVYYILQESDGLGQGFIMEWLDGEALGAKIARGNEFAAIRPKLAFQCGETLARIHSIDLTGAGIDDCVLEMTPEEFVQQTWDGYKVFDCAQPMIDYTGRWLMQNLPKVDKHCLVHNDFRNGNIMMSPETGIVAVLDWELAHIGDPMRDLGWICTNSWRFGKSEFPVGGFGSREDLFAGYESVSGVKVDPEHVKFWEVFGSFWWAIGCLRMAEHYRHGPDASVERPAIGRRSSECQIDCVNLLIPGPFTVADQVPLTLSSNMPRSDELLTSVRDFLREEVMSEVKGRTHFLSRVAANSLDVVLRELELGPAGSALEQEGLQSLLGRTGSMEDLRSELTKALRDSSMPLDQEGLGSFLRQSVASQIAIDQPKYSGYLTALNRIQG